MKKRALLFPGQGVQRKGMGLDLYESSMVARMLYDSADAQLGFSLTSCCFDEKSTRLHDLDICRPAIFVHGLALLHALQQEYPDFTYHATAGLSLGECAAHVAAGSFDFKHGLKLVRKSGELMQQASQETPGGMLTLIDFSQAEANRIAIQAGLDVANFNSPSQFVLSGPKSLISKAMDLALGNPNGKAVPLKMNFAAHSQWMDWARQPMADFLEKIPISTPTVTVMSNVRGTPVTDPVEIRQSLADLISGSVQWINCIRSLRAQGIEEMIEFGPRPVLNRLIHEIDPSIQCGWICNFQHIENYVASGTSREDLREPLRLRRADGRALVLEPELNLDRIAYG